MPLLFAYAYSRLSRDAAYMLPASFDQCNGNFLFFSKSPDVLRIDFVTLYLIDACLEET